MMEKNDALQEGIEVDLQRLAPLQELLTKVLAEMVRLNSLFVQCLSALPLRLLLVDEQRRVLAVSQLCLDEVLHARREAVLEQCLPKVLGLLEETGGEDCGTAAFNEESLDEDINEWLRLEAAMSGDMPWSGRLHGCLVEMQPLYTYDQRAWLLLFGPAQQELGKPNRPEQVADIEKSERLVQMGQLSGGVAHELKNTLQNVGGMMQILQFKYMQDESLQRSLSIVLEELAAAGGLLSGFLGMSRLDIQVGECSLNDAVREALLLAYGSCHINRIEVVEELDEALPLVYMDKSRIKQVIINCLDNAREAILTKRRSGAEAGHIRICTSFEPELEQVVLSFEDDGIGLDPEDAACFFKPFFTTKEQGTGMGTSISAAIVRMHGGEMTATGEPEAGCLVTVRLPLHSSLPVDKQDLYAELAEML